MQRGLTEDREGAGVAEIAMVVSQTLADSAYRDQDTLRVEIALPKRFVRIRLAPQSEPFVLSSRLANALPPTAREMEERT